MDLTIQDWHKGRSYHPWLVKFHLAVEDVEDDLAQGHSLHGLTDYWLPEVSLQGDFKVLHGYLDIWMHLQLMIIENTFWAFLPQPL